MKNIFLVVVLFFALFILAVSDFHGTVVYDCRDAHWMPDVPVDVKRECQKLFKQEWERKQEENKKKLIST